MTIRKIILVIAAPLVLAAAGVTHPHGLSRSTAAEWTQLHIALLPVFPLLTIGLLVPLWHRPRPDLAGIATVTAWAGAFVYAAYYTGLDAVAGIAAGTAVEHTAETAALGPIKRPLYHTGEALGQAGAYALIGAVVATAIALFPKHGARVVPGTVILLVAGWFFVDSHIFWPRGVWTMLGFALGFALLAWGTARSTPAARDRRSVTTG
ncbi:membrane protein [Streptomyces sp. MMG1533]|nr:membrane protein [Streptomyces sp. MMG1533]